ncbi:MAG: type I-B CRISPR-associated protein Cas7/Csh2 [Flavobacteriales bacterium]
MEGQENNIQEKSEILFLYDSNYSIPNGDPFTGEQRYDEETKKILVSDVRIKRFIRDYLENQKEEDVYVSNKTERGQTDAKAMIKWIAQNRNKEEITDVAKLLTKQIDVRLFGGISTLKKNDLTKAGPKETNLKNGHVQFTGPVQFSLLNPSLNKVNLRMHQNTSHFTSSEDKEQGAIGTTTVVPYAMNQIHGWINPKVAQETGLNNNDLNKMFEALWYGTSGDGSSHSRSKIGQNSVLLLQVVYSKPNQKIYGLDKLIKPIGKNGKKDEQWRNIDDFDLDLERLFEKINTDKVREVRFFTEIPEIEEKLTENDKFKKLNFAKE